MRVMLSGSRLRSLPMIPVRDVALLLALALVSCTARMPPPPQTSDLEVTLLGTGDPTPLLERFGPATLIQAGNTSVLVDAGRGVMQRLYQIGVRTDDIDAIFLTHLHSDHVVGLVDLWLTGWVIEGRATPLVVYGPPGTQAMMQHLRAAYNFDIAIRTAESRRSPEGIRVQVVEIDDGFLWSRDGTEVRAFFVDHEPVEPAFGFRLTHNGRSVTLSGDTRYSENLIANARGTDLLIHEVAEAPARLRQRRAEIPRLAHHTQAADAGRVFSVVAPRLAVYAHLVFMGGLGPDDLIPLTRETYAGPLVVGTDLMQISVGEQLLVRQWPAIAPSQVFD